MFLLVGSKLTINHYKSLKPSLKKPEFPPCVGVRKEDLLPFMVDIGLAPSNTEEPQLLGIVNPASLLAVYTYRTTAVTYDILRNPRT